MGRRGFVLNLALLTAAVGALVTVSLGFFARSPHAALVVSFWPANALALAFILRACKTPRERIVALGATFLTLVGVSVALRADTLIAVGFSLANLVEIAAAAWLLRGLSVPLRDEKSLVKLVVAAVLAAPALSAVVAGAAMALVRGSAAGAGQWFVCDAVGMAVFAPFFLSVRLENPFKALKNRAVLPAIAAQILLGVITAGVFVGAERPLVFAISPFVVLAVWTGRSVGGALAVAQIAVIGCIATALGYGPIVHVESNEGLRILGLQLFIAAQILTVHPLAMALARLDRFAAATDELRAEAERRSDMRAKLLAHVSHEIRSPLSGVLGLAELMKNGALGDLTDAQKDGMDQITDCAADMQALASDLLDAAAVQSGRMKVELADVEVSDAMYQAVAGARFRTREYSPRIELTGDWSGDLVVRADPQRLKQVLINLMVNAAKYGGRPPRIEIGARAVGARIRIQVCDNGPGVPAALRETLFKPFERLGAEKTDVEGSGLGLAVSRELMQLQGGHIDVEDGPLGGACFFVELERVANKQAKAA